jgi:hypothetical protein
MPDLTIHDIPEDALAAFEAHAGRRGQSSEAALLELIHAAAHEERLMQDLERASRAAENVHTAVYKDPDAAQKQRRRYRSVQPTPTARRP